MISHHYKILTRDGWGTVSLQEWCRLRQSLRTQPTGRILRNAAGKPGSSEPWQSFRSCYQLKVQGKDENIKEIKRLYREHCSAMSVVHSKDLSGCGSLGGSASASRKQRQIKGYLVISVSELKTGLWELTRCSVYSEQH